MRVAHIFVGLCRPFQHAACPSGNGLFRLPVGQIRRRARFGPCRASRTRICASTAGTTNSRRLFVQSLERCRVGEKDLERFFTPEQQVFLASVGQTPQEIFDFADDHTRYDGDPDWETYLLVSAVRRDYFLTIQHGTARRQTVSMDDLPAKDARLGGIPWLPRIIKKAEAKLRGEMPPT